MGERWVVTRETGWTPWADGRSIGPIERVLWQAKALHFPKDNVSHWYDGSELVGIGKWGFHGERWTMKKPPADWTPMPPGYRQAAEKAWRDWHSRNRPDVAATAVAVPLKTGRPST